MSRRKHFDAGHGNPEYTVTLHPAFDWDHDLHHTDYGRSVRDYVSRDLSLEQADAMSLVDFANRNPFNDEGDAEEQARYSAYEGYLENQHVTAHQSPEMVLGTLEKGRVDHPQSSEDLEKRLDSLHAGAMSNVDSYKDEYLRDKD